jgi:RNA polymerase sigma-70 factor (ECF subfamily)
LIRGSLMPTLHGSQKGNLPMNRLKKSLIKAKNSLTKAKVLPKEESSTATFGIDMVCDSESIVSDEEIVDSYLKTRCPHTFEQLVRRYEREIYTYLRRFLGDAQEAEDVFQATFLSVHLRIDQFEQGRRFRPWLYAIASNKAIDFMRRNKRHQIGSLNTALSNSDGDETLMHKLPSDQVPPDEFAERNENAARVREALSQLNEPTQQLIQLAFFQEMKYADISEILKIPVGTVKSRVFTAIRKLNAIWMRMEEKDGNQDES